VPGSNRKGAPPYSWTCSKECQRCACLSTLVTIRVNRSVSLVGCKWGALVSIPKFSTSHSSCQCTNFTWSLRKRGCTEAGCKLQDIMVRLDYLELRSDQTLDACTNACQQERRVPAHCLARWLMRPACPTVTQVGGCQQSGASTRVPHWQCGAHVQLLLNGQHATQAAH